MAARTLYAKTPCVANKSHAKVMLAMCQPKMPLPKFLPRRDVNCIATRRNSNGSSWDVRKQSYD
jgi:hypothetical protein